jgi:hypothetical protein
MTGITGFCARAAAGQAAAAPSSEMKSRRFNTSICPLPTKAGLKNIEPVGIRQEVTERFYSP